MSDKALATEQTKLPDAVTPAPAPEAGIVSPLPATTKPANAFKPGDHVVIEKVIKETRWTGSAITFVFEDESTAGPFTPDTGIATT